MIQWSYMIIRGKQTGVYFLKSFNSRARENDTLITHFKLHRIVFLLWYDILEAIISKYFKLMRLINFQDINVALNRDTIIHYPIS